MIDFTPFYVNWVLDWPEGCLKCDEFFNGLYDSFDENMNDFREALTNDILNIHCCIDSGLL